MCWCHNFPPRHTSGPCNLVPLLITVLWNCWLVLLVGGEETVFWGCHPTFSFALLSVGGSHSSLPVSQSRSDQLCTLLIVVPLYQGHLWGDMRTRQEHFFWRSSNSYLKSQQTLTGGSVDIIFKVAEGLWLAKWVRMKEDSNVSVHKLLLIHFSLLLVPDYWFHNVFRNGVYCIICGAQCRKKLWALIMKLFRIVKLNHLKVEVQNTASCDNP